MKQVGMTSVHATTGLIYEIVKVHAEGGEPTLYDLQTEQGDFFCDFSEEEMDEKFYGWSFQTFFGAPAEPPAPALTEAQIRKGRPVATGVLSYFPDAIDAVAEVSKRGNDQHNPGEPLHWARGKSTDQLDAAVRHIMDHMRGRKVDAAGNRTLAQAAWRILAECQLDIEAEQDK